MEVNESIMQVQVNRVIAECKNEKDRLPFQLVVPYYRDQINKLDG